MRYLLGDLERKLEEAKAGGEDALNAKRKQAMYEALIKEMEYFEKAKLIVTVEDVAKLITPPLKATQTKLRALARQLAPQLFGLSSIVEVEELLEQRINECLTESANIPIASLSVGSAQQGDLAIMEGVTSSAKSKHKPVGRRKSHTKQRV
jgi:hypothetical protein